MLHQKVFSFTIRRINRTDVGVVGKSFIYLGWLRTLRAHGIDGLHGASVAELLVAVAGPEWCHFSHPLHKNIPFYRCLRFFYPSLLSLPRL